MGRRPREVSITSGDKSRGLAPSTERGLLLGAAAYQGRALTAALVSDSRIPRPTEATLGPLGELVREHTPYVWRVLRSLGVRETDLEDVCQETFIVVHRRLHTFEGRASLRSWIYGIALRVVSDYRGKAHRRREILTPEPPEPMHAAPQEAALERKRAWKLIDHLLERLSDEQRQVFVLYEVEQLSMRQVSEIIGCPLQTAYSRLHAARKLVQEKLGRMRSAGETR